MLALFNDWMVLVLFLYAFPSHLLPVLLIVGDKKTLKTATGRTITGVYVQWLFHANLNGATVDDEKRMSL
jgi:hypothetical protein